MLLLLCTQMVLTTSCYIGIQATKLSKVTLSLTSIKCLSSSYGLKKNVIYFTAIVQKYKQLIKII